MTEALHPLVSVVVINHNYARYLAAAVDSVLRQTWKTIEILIVDDGSTDDSLQVIAALPPSVRRVLKENEGHVSAVNLGGATATGDLVIFLDADDLLYERCVQSVVTAWRAGASKVQYRLDTVDEHGCDQHMTFPYFADDLTPAEARRQALDTGVYPWTVSSGNAYAAGYLRQVLPIDRAIIPRSPDGVLNKLAPLYGDVVSINEALGAYRVHGGNKWAQGKGPLNASRILETVRLDLTLHRIFLEHAALRGAATGRKPELSNPQHLEYRLLALRLNPRAYDIEGDSRLRLAIKGARSAARAANFSLSGRLLWTLWFFVLAFLPRRTAEKVYAMARTQTGRRPLAKRLITLARGRARRHAE